MSKTVSIRLIRHGVIKSGGSVFEEFLIKNLCTELRNNGIQTVEKTIVYNRIFHGFQNLILLYNGWRDSTSDINIVTARLGVSSLLRNVFNDRKTIVVLYNFDPNDHKSTFLKIYFRFLFLLLKIYKSTASIITQSDYFENYLQKKLPGRNIFRVPNLFHLPDYGILKPKRDDQKIFLGQFSDKNDPSIFKLTHKLKNKGFNCIFCTLNSAETGIFPDFEIKYYEFDQYLQEMASSYCSIAFSGVNEGWNRIVHESILVGTPVIGYPRGGLGDLLIESESYIVENPEEAIDLILNRTLEYRTSMAFIQKYSTDTMSSWLQPLKFMLLHKNKQRMETHLS